MVQVRQSCGDGGLNRASSWTSAPVRDGLSRSPADRAAESRSLEESFRVVAAVPFLFEVFALSEQSAHSLRLRGDSNRPSFSTIRLSRQFEWAYSHSTLSNLVAVSAARLLRGAFVPEYGPRQVDLSPTQPVSWQVHCSDIPDCGGWQTVDRICCRQRFP